MRLAALFLLALTAPAALGQSFSGSIRSGLGCPDSPRCVDRIRVEIRPGSLTGRQGAAFIGIVPLANGEPALPGAFLNAGGALAVSASPAPFATGPLRPITHSTQIPGGVCAEARRQGVSGAFALVAGLGLTDPRFAELSAKREQLLASARDAEERASIQRALDRVEAASADSASAAQDMLATRRYAVLATIQCQATPP